MNNRIIGFDSSFAHSYRPHRFFELDGGGSASGNGGQLGRAVDLLISSGPLINIPSSPLPSPMTSGLKVGRELAALRIGGDTPVLTSPPSGRRTVLGGTSIVISHTTTRSVDIEVGGRDPTGIDSLDDHRLSSTSAGCPGELVAHAASGCSSVSVTSKAVGKRVVYDDGLVT